MWYVRTAKAQTSLRICKSLEYSMTVKLLTEQHLEFLSLKGGCKGPSESTLVKIPHCWKSRVAAQIMSQLSFRTMLCHSFKQLFEIRIAYAQTYSLNMRAKLSIQYSIYLPKQFLKYLLSVLLNYQTLLILCIFHVCEQRWL